MKQFKSLKEHPFRTSVMKERADCTVIATAIACRIPYPEAHEMVRMMGRPNRQGFYTNIIAESLPQFGYEAIELKRIKQKNGSLYTPKTIGKKLKSGYYICQVNGHAFAVVNGVVEDWTDGRRHRIKRIWKIKKKHKVS